MQISKQVIQTSTPRESLARTFSFLVGLLMTGMIISIIPHLRGMDSYRPKTVESFSFICALLFLPVFLFGGYKIGDRLLTHLPKSKIRVIDRLIGWINIVFCICCFIVINNQHHWEFFKRNTTIGTFNLEFFVLLGTVLISFFKSTTQNWQTFLKPFTYFLCTWMILKVSIVIFCGYYADIYTQNLTFSGWNAINFNATFHGVVQVFFGQYLLYDTFSQYGLYPFFLNPIFKLIGLNVPTFTSVIAILSCLTYYLCYTIIFRILTDKICAFAICLTLTWYHCFSLGFISFATTPIRTFMPVLVIAVAQSFFAQPSRSLYFANALTCTAALFWNLETGIFSFVAWFGALIFLEFAEKKNKRPLLKRIFFHFGVAALSVTTALCVYFLIGWAKSKPPLFSEMFRSQNQFYFEDIYRGLLNPLHPWTLIICLYIISLSYVIQQTVNKTRSPLTDFLLFLSLFGFGLFSYYQYHTEDSCFQVIIYPALFISAIHLEIIRRELKQAFSFQKSILASLLIGIFVWNSTCWLNVNENYLKDDFLTQLKNKKTLSPDLVNLTFIKEQLAGYSKALIVSDNSGIYHLVTHTILPIKIAGPDESVYSVDGPRLSSFIHDSKLRAGLPVIVDEQQILWTGNFYTELKEVLKTSYFLKATSPDQRVKVFFPKNDLALQGS